MYNSYDPSYSLAINTSGIVLSRTTFTGNTGNYPTIVNSKSFNSSPFKTIRFLVSNLLQGIETDASFVCIALTSSKQSIANSAVSVNVPTGDKYVYWDVSAISQQMFFVIRSDFYYRPDQWGQQKLIIKRIDFIT